MRIYLITILIFFFFNINAQEFSYPNFIPPSPEVAQISQYVDFRSDIFTGAVTQNIPIHTIENGSLIIPISLNYSSNGFPVTSSPDWVGRGWTLNAGGVVTRIVKGVPDDSKYNIDGNSGFFESIIQSSIDYEYLNNSRDQSSTRSSYLEDISKGCLDAQPDLFIINVNGLQAKFHFNWEGEMILSSEQDIKIDVLWESSLFSKIDGFVITGPMGNKYKFDLAETTFTLGNSNFNFCLTPSQTYKSSWRLSEISSYNDSRKILFNYSDYLIRDHNIFSSEVRGYPVYDNSPEGHEFKKFTSFSGSNIDINAKRLSSITTVPNNDLIVFEKTNEQTSSNGSYKYNLGEISISNQHNLITKYIINYNSISINSIKQVGGDGTESNPYSFSYYGGIKARTTKQKDHWGFGNSNPVNDLFPPYKIPNSSGSNFVGTGDRSPEYDGSKAGVMYKVVYPTLGYDVYDLELNDYGYVGGNQIDEYVTIPTNINVQSFAQVGACYNGPAITDQKSFTVTENPNGDQGSPDCNGAVPVIVSYNAYVRKHSRNYLGAGPDYSPKIQIKDDQGNLVYGTNFVGAGDNLYNNVNTYFELCPGNYTIESFARLSDCEDPYNRDQATASISYERFTNVKKTKKPTGGVRVKKISKYNHDNSIVNEYNYSYLMENGYSSGVIHKEPQYTYFSDKRQSVKLGVTGASHADYEAKFFNVFHSDISNLALVNGVHVAYKRVIATQNGGQLGHKEYQFLRGTNFVYNEVPFPPAINNSHNNGKIVKEIVRNSQNQVLNIKEYDYLQKLNRDYGLKIQFKGGNPPGATGIENYFYFGRHFVQHGFLKLKSINNTSYLDGEPISTNIDYSYDSNMRKIKQIASSTSQNDEFLVDTMFYPEDVGEISGITGSEINTLNVMNSQHRKGNVIRKNSYYQMPSNEIIKHSVHNSFTNFGNNNIYQSELKTSKQTSTLEERIIYHEYDSLGNVLEVSQANGLHTVYIWGYNKTQPIAKIENATLMDVDLYTSNLQSLSNSDNDRTSDYAGNEGLLRKGLDSLRDALPNAMVTTYTYDPLIGVTSVTDPKGYTTYYEYDGLNRLEKVRDAEGNLISKNEYNYKTNQD